jgi:hypothetical protein
MRFALRALLAGALGIAVAFLVACGDRSNLLPGSSADKLNSQLDQVSAAVSGGDCAKAVAAVNAYKDTVLGLPGTVSATLRANLIQGAQTIAQMAPNDCRQASQPSTTSTTPTTTTPTTPTATTPTTPTTTTPTTPTATNTIPTTPSPTPAPTPTPSPTPPETQPPSTGTNGGGGAPPPGNSGGGAGGGGAATGN